ncbi:MAG: nicotinate phosphoribosyltransferase [Candidatus Omnitrophica bacterium]|nr:nicotinate phosphoribosyltransferase [Candidatus Omnitrophota bacterium]
MSKALAVDLYELTMAQVYHKYKPGTYATFDLFVRSARRPFYVACGIDEALNYLAELSFDKEDIEYLKSLGMFEEEFLAYLEKFRFQGTVWAVEEPEIVFANEPIMRITASLIEAQIVESFLLNQVNLGTTLATKAARVVIAAQGKGVFDFSFRRTQGVEASLACAKYSYMTGVLGTSNVLAGQKYRIPVSGTIAHSFVMSFDREIESFLSFAKEFPTRSIFLVDTYDVRCGIDSALKVARFLKQRGIDLVGIRLDSGNLVEDSHYARVQLDREGFIDTMIVASGDLDEYKIEELLDQRAPIDVFGVGSNLGSSSDSPYTDVIYKLVEIKEKGKDSVPTMKTSEGKSTLPGRKQVYRSFNPAGIMMGDEVALDKEDNHEKKLLRKVMEKGKRLYREKTLGEKRKIFNQKQSALPDFLRKAEVAGHYDVKVSKRLSEVTVRLTDEMKSRTEEKIVFFDVDTQYDFLDKKGALRAPGAEAIIANLKKLTQCASAGGIRIISSLDTHRRDDPEFKEFPAHCVKNTRGHKKIKETTLKNAKTLSVKKMHSFAELRTMLRKHPQLILEKHTLNVFSNPNAHNLLEVIFPDKTYVYGAVTEYCVREVVEGLLKNNFSVAIVEDAVKEVSKKEKDRLFASWRRRGVEFIKTQTLLSSLSHR